MHAFVPDLMSARFYVMFPLPLAHVLFFITGSTLDHLYTQIQLLEVALGALRCELDKPSGVFDPYTAMGALENLVNVARDRRDTSANRYNNVYKQCCSLISKKHLQPILVKLVGDGKFIDMPHFGIPFFIITQNAPKLCSILTMVLCLRFSVTSRVASKESHLILHFLPCDDSLIVVRVD